MRRLILLSLVLSLLGSFVPLAAAQDTKTSFDLTATYEVPTLGIMFDYPDGWVSDTSGGVTLVSNPNDLSAATDNNPATKALDPFISLDEISLAGTPLPPDALLDDALTLVNQVLGFTTEDQFEVPVMARRAITLYGADQNGDYGLVTFWLQDGKLVLFILSAASADEVRGLSSAWKLILNSVRPIDTLPLTESVASDFMQTTIAYPTGWTIYNTPDRLGIFEQTSDRDLYMVGNDAYFTGVVITALYQATDDLTKAGILPEVSLDALLALNLKFLGLTHPEIAEAVVFGEPALIIKAVNTGGFYGYGAMGFVDDHVYFVMASSLDENKLDAFIPTFQLMLQTMQR